MYDDKEKEPFTMNLQLSRIVQLRDAIEILCHNADKRRAISELTGQPVGYKIKGSRSVL